jgi:transcriptional regulator
LYLPPEFKEDRSPVLHAAIAATGLATLISLGAKGLIASHIPIFLDPAPAPLGTLYGHVSRGNPHWRQTIQGHESLAIFLGPDAYITPTWYATKRDTGKVVPTWNYVAIHAYGRPEFFSDTARLEDIVTRLTQLHEGKRATPWAPSDAPADFLQDRLKAIIGFALPIARLEGKWKMSQNRPPQDRAGVIEGLRDEGGDAAQEVAAIVAAHENTNT